MKIRNKENGKNVVYVQLKDLKAVIDIKKDIPIEIQTEIENKMNITLKENDFIRFEQSQIINFFDSIDWILDYKLFVNSHSYEIEFQYERTKEKLTLYHSAVNSLPDDETIKTDYKTLTHIMNDMKLAIQSIVYNNVDLPLIENCDTPAFYLKNHQDYKIQASLNPDVFLIRKLNLTLASLDEIDYHELKEFIKLIKKQECEINLELNLEDTSVIFCKVSKIPIKQNVVTKPKRKFFMRISKKHNTNK